MDIPKLLHVYWGGGTLSFLQYLTVMSFKMHNPEYSVKLHTPLHSSDIPMPWITGEQHTSFRGKDYYPMLLEEVEVHEIDFKAIGLDHLHEIHKSDVIRWKLLYDEGGIWSDMDILYTRPLQAALDLYPSMDMSVVLYPGSDGLGSHTIGFYMTKPNMQFFKDAYKLALQHSESPHEYQSLGAGLLASMYDKFPELQEAYPSDTIYNISKDIVYPCFWTQPAVKQIFFDTPNILKPDTIGIHWFNGNEMSKLYLNSYAAFKDNESLMSRLIKATAGRAGLDYEDFAGDGLL